VLNKNGKYLKEGKFQIKCDVIILDESESLLAHIDEKTMEIKEIQNCNFFNTLLNHSGQILMTDGDVSERSLTFAKQYGEAT
jgi:hypothetical protein